MPKETGIIWEIDLHEEFFKPWTDNIKAEVLFKDYPYPEFPVPPIGTHVNMDSSLRLEGEVIGHTILDTEEGDIQSYRINVEMTKNYLVHMPTREELLTNGWRLR